MMSEQFQGNLPLYSPWSSGEMGVFNPPRQLQSDRRPCNFLDGHKNSNSSMHLDDLVSRILEENHPFNEKRNSQLFETFSPRRIDEPAYQENEYWSMNKSTPVVTPDMKNSVHISTQSSQYFDEGYFSHFTTPEREPDQQFSCERRLPGRQLFQGKHEEQILPSGFHDLHKHVKPNHILDTKSFNAWSSMKKHETNGTPMLSQILQSLHVHAKINDLVIPGSDGFREESDLEQANSMKSPWVHEPVSFALQPANPPDDGYKQNCQFAQFDDIREHPYNNIYHNTKNIDTKLKTQALPFTNGFVNDPDIVKLGKQLNAEVPNQMNPLLSSGMNYYEPPKSVSNAISLSNVSQNFNDESHQPAHINLRLLKNFEDRDRITYVPELMNSELKPVFSSAANSVPVLNKPPTYVHSALPSGIVMHSDASYAAMNHLLDEYPIKSAGQASSLHSKQFQQLPGSLHPHQGMTDYYPVFEPNASQQPTELTMDLYSPFFNPVHTYLAQNQYRRISSTNELHFKIEECFEQCKNLEKERQTIEAELFHRYPGQNISSINATIFPRLSSNPTRVDKLVVESLREHAKVVTLLSKMTTLNDEVAHPRICSTMDLWIEGVRKVQARRKEENVNATNRQHDTNGRCQDDKDIKALTSSIEELSQHCRKARTSLWCAFQIILKTTLITPQQPLMLGTNHMESDVKLPEQKTNWMTTCLSDDVNNNNK